MNLQLKKIHQFIGHNASIYALAQGTAVAKVLSGGADKILAQWDLEKIQADNFSARFPSPIYSICPVYENNILLVGTLNGSLHILDLQKKEEIKILKYHTAGIFDLKVSLTKNVIITCGADGKLNVFSLADFTFIKNINLSNIKLRNLALNEERNELIVCDGNGMLHILNLSDFSAKHSFLAHQLSCNCALYHPGNRYLITGGRDAHLNVWDMENNFQQVQSIPAHNFAIYDIKYLKGLNVIATASRDKTVKLWNADNFDFLVRINKENYEGHINSVNKIHWNEQQQLLVSAGDDRVIILWRIAT